ncbi:MAG: metallophosphoesterase family protein [Chitinophagales bacterium]
MKRIGLISDTHGYLDTAVKEHFSGVDEIWHAGDIGDLAVTDALKAIKPVRAVFGNIDDSRARAEWPEDARFTVEGVSVWITHIGGYPGHYSPRVRRELALRAPDIFVCGHSHILRVMRDPAFGQMLVLNPGAAGIHGFHRVKTLLRFSIHDGKVLDMEAIEMGKRGQL